MYILYVNVYSGIAPYTYSWNNGGKTNPLSEVKEGLYYVTVRDAKGCRNSGSIYITDPEKITPDVIVNNALCKGSSDGEVSLNAHGGSGTYNYLWNGYQVSETTVRRLSAGVYMLTVIDSRDCHFDTLITVHEPEKIVIHKDERNTVLPFCPDWSNGTLAIYAEGGTPPYSYSWKDYPQTNDSILSDIKEGFYPVSVTDENNCFADTTFKLKSEHFTCLNIPTAFTPNNDGANDYWDVSYINDDQGEAPFYVVYPQGSIKIYDRWGNLVFMCNDGCHDMWWGQDMKGRDLPADSYHYIIELNNGEGRPPLRGAVTIIR